MANKILNWANRYNPWHREKVAKAELSRERQVWGPGVPNLMRPIVRRQYSQNYFVIPRYDWDLWIIESAAETSLLLRTIFSAINREVFRNGAELVQAANTDESDTSGEDVTVLDEAAAEAERKRILDKAENVNDNGQSLLEVQSEVENDFQKFDDGYAIYIMNYIYDTNGEINAALSTLKEVVRGDPKVMGLVMNSRDQPGYDDDGKEILVCPVHREDELYRSRIEDPAPTCRTCGLRAYRVHFFYMNDAGRKTFYFKDEIVHRTKYLKTKRIGFSPIMTVWLQVSTQNAQAEFIHDNYVSGRSPAGMVLFNTANADAAHDAWEAMLLRAEENPTKPPALAIEGTPGAKKIAEYIDFMKSLKEMEYMEQRNEDRRQVGALFGVMPIWQADLSQGGGLNNEGMQITVSNRTIEYSQSIHNNYYFPHFLDLMKSKGWVYRLKPNEEQDEMAKLMRQNQSLANGEIAMRVGLKAKYDDRIGEVIIESGDLEKAEPMPFGPFGGSNEDKEPGPKDDTSDDKNPTGEAANAPNEGKPVKPPEPPKADQGVKTTKSLLTTPFDRKQGPDVISAPAQKTIPPQGFSYDLPLIDFSILAKARNRPPFTKLASVIKTEIQKFVSQFKRAPSVVEMAAVSESLKRNLDQSLKTTMSTVMRSTYVDQMDFVGKELGVNLTFDGVDRNAVAALMNRDVLSKAFAGMSTKITAKMQDVIKEAFIVPGELDVRKITDKLKAITDVADFHAETIARVETGRVASAARRASYKKEDPGNEFIYKWIGPDDHRTTETSKVIKEDTKDGVVWDDLVQIVSEESAKSFPTWKVDPNAPQSHWNSRHIFVRLPNVTKSHTDLLNEQLDFKLKQKEFRLLQKKQALIDELSSGNDG